MLKQPHEIIDESDHRVPPFLPFTRGMEYVLTESVDESLGLVEGAKCIAQKFAPSLESGRCTIGPDNDVHVSTLSPEVIVVSTETTNEIQLPGLEKGYIALFPTKLAASERIDQLLSKRPFDRIGFALNPTFAVAESEPK